MPTRFPAATGSIPTAMHVCCFVPAAEASMQQFGDLNRVERGSLQQLVRRREYRDRMAAGVAEIPANAADQDVILARRIDRHREIIFHPIVDDLHTRRIDEDRAHLVLGDRVFAFEVMAWLCARNTGTRTQVTPTAIPSSSKIFRVSCMTLVSSPL